MRYQDMLRQLTVDKEVTDFKLTAVYSLTSFKTSGSRLIKAEDGNIKTSLSLINSVSNYPANEQRSPAILVRFISYLQLNYNQIRKDCQFMQGLQKKKRTHSGSRSKSRKYKNGELSVDIKTRQVTTNPTQPNKNTTQNSSSLNKSKPSRKTSIKQQKKHTKSSNKESKDPVSHSISADRKHSLTKMNKTQVNYENEDIQKLTFKIMMRLKNLKLPSCTNIQLLQRYFEDLRDCYEGADDSLYNFCMELHSYYLTPLKPLFEMLLPYEDYLSRKEEIGKQIDQQIFQNEKLWEELSPVDVQIFKLKEKIEENRSLIEKKKQHKQQRQQSELEEKCKSNQPKSYPSQPKSAFQTKQFVRPEKIQHIGKGFKLDLEHINKQVQVGFHEEFYSKLEEFSQSWRNQALREKRF